MTPEQDRLVLEHLEQADRMTSFMIRKFRYFEPVSDDIRAGAMLGLCEAAQRFDPSRGVPFPRYAWHWMKARAFDAAHSSLNPVDHHEHGARKIDMGRGEYKGDQGEEFTAELQEQWLSQFQPVEPEFPPGVEGVDRLMEYLAEYHPARDVAIYRAYMIEAPPDVSRGARHRKCGPSGVTMSDLAAKYGLTTSERVRQIVAKVQASVDRFAMIMQREAA